MKYAAFVPMGHITPALCFTALAFASARLWVINVTYTLESEHGSSVKAANFKYDGIAGGLVWSGKRRNDALPAEMKKRWVFYCK